MGTAKNWRDMATFGTTSPLTFLINPLTPINLPLHANQTPNPIQPLTPGDQLCLVPNVALSGTGGAGRGGRVGGGGGGGVTLQLSILCTTIRTQSGESIHHRGPIQASCAVFYRTSSKNSALLIIWWMIEIVSNNLAEVITHTCCVVVYAILQWNFS